MLNRDVFTALALLLLCGFSWLQVKTISKLGSFFPKVCIVILAFFSLLLLFSSLKKQYEKGIFEGINLKYVKTMSVGFILYVTAIYLIGFFLGSLLFLFAFGLFLDSERTKKTFIQAFLVSLCATTIFYLVFHNIFSVPLPPGLIFGG